MLRNTFAVALALYGWGMAIGCSSAQQRADQAIVIGTYERELEHCKEQGKAAGSYAVYEACANAVDRTLCATRGVRCMDGGAK